MELLYYKTKACFIHKFLNPIFGNVKAVRIEGSGLEELTDDEDYSGDEFAEEYKEYEEDHGKETKTEEGKILDVLFRQLDIK